MSVQLLPTRATILSPVHGPKTFRPAFAQSRLRKSAMRIFSDSKLCSIATVTRNKKAHINTAYFAFSNDLTLFFLSDPNSTHCQNLSSNPSTAVAIYNSSQHWKGPDRGIQLFGRCAQTEGVQTQEAERFYSKRFPKYLKWKKTFSTLGRRNTIRYQFYRFVRERLKILDEREFGYGVFLEVTVNRKTERQWGNDR